MNPVTFTLPKQFVDGYAGQTPPFGFDGLGEFVFFRTYSHPKPDGTNESWSDVVERVVNHTYTIQKRHALEHCRPWSEEKAVDSAQKMYDKIWNLKFTPPGRGLWAMGAPITAERDNYMALQNCAFVSTRDMIQDPSLPFEFMMDVSMLGVGCGFDTKGAGTLAVQSPYGAEVVIIEDSREGWVDSLRRLMRAFLRAEPMPLFDYRQIRPAGEPIKGFGGVSSGPEPLKKFHIEATKLLIENIGRPVTSTVIVDLMNMIGQLVVAGNVRRTAQLAIGDPDDNSYLDLKNYELNPHRVEFGWTSNNSIAARAGMDYSFATKRTMINGEPGYIWLDNARRGGRLGNPRDSVYCEPDNIDGFNPCVEQPLRSFEVCTLVETYPANHDTVEEYLDTLKYAFLYAKTVTLAEIHWPQTNEIVKENRRIGTSMTGIVQAIDKFGREEFDAMAESGYERIRHWDRLYSEWLGVNESVRVTTVKPSGTVSLLAGALPGVHRAESEYYIRRVRISKYSPLLQPAIDAGYHVEPSQSDPTNTMVISFPVHVKNAGKTLDDTSAHEQIHLAADMQRLWSDNGVSVTVTFDPEDEGPHLENLLNAYDDRLKAVSFLPKLEMGAFPQMPYERITPAEYVVMSENIKPLDMSGLTGSQAVGEEGCTTDACEIKFETRKNGVAVAA